MGKTPSYPRGAIVPSKCRPKKSKRGKIVSVAAEPAKCNCCGDRPLPAKIGFVVCDAANNSFVMDDYPATGGPWGPGINPVTGAFVWVNHGG